MAIFSLKTALLRKQLTPFRRPPPFLPRSERFANRTVLWERKLTLRMKLRANPWNKNFYFDRQLVQGSMTKAEHRILSHFGGRVRLIAQRSMKWKPEGVHAPPGKPPYSHAGWLRKGIEYAYDPGTKSVVIGPIRFGRSLCNPTLEYGWDVPVSLYFNKRTQQWEKAALPWHRRSSSLQTQKVKMAARPYMRPAFLQSLPLLRSSWRNSLFS